MACGCPRRPGRLRRRRVLAVVNEEEVLHGPAGSSVDAAVAEVTVEVVHGAAGSGELTTVEVSAEVLHSPAGSGDGAAAALAAISAEVVGCRRCPRLVAWRELVAVEKRASFAGEDYWGRPVPGFGDPLAGLLVVGLAPAAHGGNRTGRVFTGDRSGDWVYRALHRAGYANQPTSIHAGDGLALTGAYVAAAVRCAPPANKPTPAERDECVGYLAREMAALASVRVVVALGQFAYDAVARLVGLRPRPRFGHLVEAPLPDGRLLLCSYHPSQQNTFTGTLTEEMFDAVFERARVVSSGRA